MTRCLPLFLACALAACSGPPASPEALTFVLDADTIAEIDGVQVVQGGYSALALAPDGELWTVSDRGPNLDAESREGVAAKRFALPDYAPPLARLTFLQGRARVSERRAVFAPGGRMATGRPPQAAGDAEVERALGPGFEPLAPDPWGIDAEGLAFDGTSLWLAEEYRPSLWRLDPESGVVRERWMPAPEAAIDRALPPVIAGRQPNLGFEGVAVVGRFVVASLQGPLQGDGADPATPFVRLLRLDPASGDAVTFAYPMDGPARKLGDLAALPDGRLLVIEHGPSASGVWSGGIYAVELDTPLAPEARPERFTSARDAREAGFPILRKRLVLDLVASGWPPEAIKPEGLALLGDGRLAVLSDNDYGVDAPALDGLAVATGVPSVLVVFAAPKGGW